ncbi:MAG: UDP-N-acetylmuramate--L-alanine ligase [Caldiserica bacterium]|nr:UDP-N-acetylmuramate--L-alanine ligase [Caldisericota bacterium]
MDGSRVHLVGIGGDGMAPLAELLLHAGAEVSGSDIAESPTVAELRARGIPVSIGHRGENVIGVRSVLVSSAIPRDNPELLAARRLGIPIVPRLLALGELLAQRKLIAVCGTHGKTTTSTWLAHLLRSIGAGFYVGASVRGLPRAAWGTSPWFVAEIDESDGHFVELKPEIVVLTNIDRDHLTSYGRYSRLKGAFRRFLAGASRCVVCGDDPPSLEAARGTKALTYGLSAGVDLRARGVRTTPGGTWFEVLVHGRRAGEAVIPAPGIHNVRNALAALATAHLLGLPLRETLEELAELPLPRRRLEVLVDNGYVLVDDYAHHPREIAAGIWAIRARWPGRRLLVLFQPHRFSRTALLSRELGRALAAADFTVVTEIYPAFEDPIPGISGMRVVEALRGHGGTGKFVATPAEAVEELMGTATPGDAIACFGAGDVWKAFRAIPGML